MLKFQNIRNCYGGNRKGLFEIKVKLNRSIDFTVLLEANGVINLYLKSNYSHLISSFKLLKTSIFRRQTDTL